jgi:hypothetical protein
LQINSRLWRTLVFVGFFFGLFFRSPMRSKLDAGRQTAPTGDNNARKSLAMNTLRLKFNKQTKLG